MSAVTRRLKESTDPPTSTQSSVRVRLAKRRRVEFCFVVVAIAAWIYALNTIHLATMSKGLHHQEAGGPSAAIVVALIFLLGILQPHRLLGSAVVVWYVLLGILMIAVVVILPNFIRCRCGGQLTACKSNLKNIGTALEMYSTDHGGRFPASLIELTYGDNYLRSIPTCPSSGMDTYSDSYESLTRPDTYTVACFSGSHWNLRLPPGFPKYTSTEGLIEKPDNRNMLFTDPLGLSPLEFSDGFVWVEWLMAAVGLLVLVNVRGERCTFTRKTIGLSLVGFVAIPWSHFLPPPDATTAYRGCAINLLRLSRQVESYRGAHGGNPPPKLDASPSCPAAGGNTYTLNLQPDGTVIIACSGRHHGAWYPACPENYPRYVERSRMIERTNTQ